MELNVKNVYNINCDWFAHGKDAAGNSKNSWNGEIVVLGNNSCFGYATDNGHKSPTHLLVGAMVEGSGLTICKIHLTNSVYDPIIFDAFANHAGEENSYYGEFLAKTYFNYVPMGVTTIKTQEMKVSREDIEKIAETYDKMQKTIEGRVDITSLTLKEYNELDYNDMSTKLQIVANNEYNNDLPDILLNKTGSQPSSN